MGEGLWDLVQSRHRMSFPVSVVNAEMCRTPARAGAEGSAPGWRSDQLGDPYTAVWLQASPFPFLGLSFPHLYNEGAREESPRGKTGTQRDEEDRGRNKKLAEFSQALPRCVSISAWRRSHTDTKVTARAECALLKRFGAFMVPPISSHTQASSPQKPSLL